MPSSSNLADYVYFVTIYNWMKSHIAQFGVDLLGRVTTWIAGMALVLVTLWILIQGYRIVTGQSQVSTMALVSNMARIVLIVTVATSMAIGGASLQNFLSTDLPNEINQVVSGSDSTPESQIDQNLAATQLALAAIDTVQSPPGDVESTEAKAHAQLIAGFGAASPAMTAGALLLLYQVAMALFIGLGPLFILCLIFDYTKPLFQKWLLYGIGTMFSLAMLSFISTLVLQVTLNVAKALWAANIINTWTGQGAPGMSSQALQQGGMGLLMTVLIISTPPMAAMFFQGTLGSFSSFSQFERGGPRGTGGLGPNGQAPGSYASYGGGGPSQATTAQSNTGQLGGGGRSLSNQGLTRSGPVADQIRPAPITVPPPNPYLPPSSDA